MSESISASAAEISSGDDTRRYCWVCYASDEDDPTASWVKPCLCRGTTKWVHQSCLQRWVDEKQKGNSTVKVNCPQCGFQYIIHFPNMGQLMMFLDRMDAFIYRVCPFVAAGVVVGSCYWVAVTYGAITVMQVLGYHDGMALMESADPLMLLVGLPTIPVFLILGKMVRWEDKVLRLLRASVRRVPFLRYVLPGFRGEGGTPTEGPTSTTAVISDPMNATRVLCGALALPTLASLAGRAFFPNCSSTLNQTLMGGLAFVAVKGFFKVYYKQQYSVIQSKRIVKDNPLHLVPASPSGAATSSSAANVSSSVANTSSSTANASSSAASASSTANASSSTANSSSPAASASSTANASSSTANASSSTANASSSAANASSSAANASSSTASASSLTANISSSTANNSSAANVSSSTANIFPLKANISSSAATISSSAANISSSEDNVPSSETDISAESDILYSEAIISSSEDNIPSSEANISSSDVNMSSSVATISSSTDLVSNVHR